MIEPANAADRKFKAEQLSLQRKADRKSTQALRVSLLAFVVSACGVYFANFYKPEDLLMTTRLLARDQIGSNRLDVAVVLTNSGKRPVVISDVILALNYGHGATLETAFDGKVQGGIWIGEVRKTTDGSIITQQDGTSLATYHARNVRLNNQEISTSSALVNDNSVAFLVLSYEPTPIDIEKEGPVVLMIGVEFSDQFGRLRRKTIPIGVAGNPPGLYNPAPGSYSRLLPETLGPLDRLIFRRAPRE